MSQLFSGNLRRNRLIVAALLLAAGSLYGVAGVDSLAQAPRESLVPATSPKSPGYTTVFLVRHAERANAQDDSPLSDIGRRRAQALAQWLRSVPLSAVFATDKLRAQETARPAADGAGVPVSGYATAAELAQAIHGRNPGNNVLSNNVLVVGHSNTVGAIAAELSGGELEVATGEAYDKLFIIVLGPDRKVILMHELHYGADYRVAESAE